MTSPDGRRWIVRRLWLPRLRRERRQDGEDEDERDGDSAAADGSVGDLLVDDLAALVLAVAAVVAVALFVLFLLPYALFALELLVLPLVLAYKVVFRRPFTVEALPLAAPRDRMRWHVVGWRESGEAVREIATALESAEAQPTPRAATRV